MAACKQKSAKIASFIIFWYVALSEVGIEKEE